MRKNTLFNYLSFIIIILFVSACTMFEPDQANVTPSEQKPLEPTAEVRPVVTETEPTDEEVTIYLVAIEDNGISGKKIGCDDSLVPVEVSSTSILATPWNAVETLLKVNADFVSEVGFYNALNQSDLELVQFETENGSAKVYLEGEMMLGGVCDTPRIEEQLYATILQVDQIDEAEIYINGELLEDYLSLK